MQNEIKSPKNGTVKKIGVTAGSAVNSGDLLAEVERGECESTPQ